MEVPGIPGGEQRRLREVVQGGIGGVEGPQDPASSRSPLAMSALTASRGRPGSEETHVPVSVATPQASDVRRPEGSQLVAGLHGVVPGRGPAEDAAAHAVAGLVRHPAAVDRAPQAVADVEELHRGPAAARPRRDRRRTRTTRGPRSRSEDALASERRAGRPTASSTVRRPRTQVTLAASKLRRTFTPSRMLTSRPVPSGSSCRPSLQGEPGERDGRGLRHRRKLAAAADRPRRWAVSPARGRPPK